MLSPSRHARYQTCHDGAVIAGRSFVSLNIVSKHECDEVGGTEEPQQCLTSVGTLFVRESELEQGSHTFLHVVCLQGEQTNCC